MALFSSFKVKTPFEATPLGVGVGTVLGLPKATAQVAKDIGQGIARSIGSTGLTLAKPLGGVDQLQPSDIKSPFGQELFKSFFGSEPVKPIEDRIAQAEIAIKQSPFAQKLGLDKMALPLAFGGVFGTTALDLTPFGSLEKNAVKALVKETSEQGAKKILTSMKVPDDIATKFAPHFAGAKTPLEVQDALDNLKGVLGVKLQAEKEALQPLAQEARKYKSAEEFVSKVQGSATQYGEYAPNFRLTGLEGYENITKLGVKPDETVTIYRGIDDIKGNLPRKINDGDFVTTDFDSAKSYAGSADDVVSMEVKAKDLYVSEPKDFKAEPFYTGAEYVYTTKGGSPMTKSQLTDFYNKVVGKSDDLTSSISKAKASGQSFDEWVKGQGDTLYHGTTKQSASAIEKEGFKKPSQLPNIETPTIKNTAKLGDHVFFTVNKDHANTFANVVAKDGKVIDVYAKDLKLARIEEAKGNNLMEKLADLKARGFDGSITGSKGSRMEEIAVWNLDKIKTKSQLTDFYNKVVGKSDDLTSSISKAKASGQSFDEWVKGQGDTLYHGTNKKINQFTMPTKEGDFGRGIYFTNDLKTAKGYAELGGKKGANIIEGYVKLKNPYKTDNYTWKNKTFPGGFPKDTREALMKRGYDGVVFTGNDGKYQEIVAFHPEQIKTRSQLKAEWDKATSEVALKTIPKSAQPIGEGASAITKADQVLEKLPEPIRAKVSSLEEIVTRRATEVKQKINVVDYLRTPDRVLQKIGFGNEAKLLRQGYEEYIKELPKNIDKITAWSKEVPSEASKTIFQYLDGQDVKLSNAELKVAGEIKTWLAEWAKRLKLPEDKTITNYITHIFDKELVAKEFDEDLAKIITDKIPGSVYDPFLLERLGAKGYKQNVWEALDAYVKRATRKVNMDEALNAIQTKAGSSLEMSNIEVSQFKYLQKYVSAINLRPTELDNLIDNTIKNVVGYKYGQRPVTYLTKILRQMTYRGMLGLNPGSALRNISQGVNTYATLGEKYTAIGYTKLLSRGAFKELADEGIFAPGFIQDRKLSSTKKAIEKIDKGLFLFFDGAEKINRGSAYFGAKSKALAQGKSAQEAIEYAKSIVRKTQFSFGSIDTPVAIQSDIVKTLAQFQNYTLKQTEFLAEMVKDKNFVGLLRYGVAGMVFVYTIGKAFGMEPKDLIPSFRFGTPPSLKFPVEVGKAALDTPTKYGQQRDLGQKVSDIGKSTVGLIPGGTQIKKSIQGLQAYNKGEDTTPSGRTRFEVPQDLEHFLQAILFGKNALPEAKEYFRSLDKKTETKGNLFGSFK